MEDNSKINVNNRATVNVAGGDNFVAKVPNSASENVVTSPKNSINNGSKYIKKRVKNYPKKLSRTSSAIQVTPSIPKYRETLRWDGWGFKDSGFSRVNGVSKFIGDRYLISGKVVPFVYEYLKEKFDIDAPTNFEARNNPEPKEEDYPKSKFTKELLEDIEYLGIEVSTKGIDRVRRAGGQAFDDVWRLEDVSKIRIPDAVAWPICHEEVVELVKLADEKNIVIIPYGGGSSVAGALNCEESEKRPILSVDTNQMNEILCVDRENMLVTAESGIIGIDLEKNLKKIGYTTGHDPDSIEVSTLGGWVSTRASGMKKNRYGNIEELTVHMKVVTPRGVYEKGSKTGRMSCGPDMNHLILGSEGMFGIITEVTLKIRQVPEFVCYESVLFPDFHTGIKFMREMAKRQWQPASIRLMDHEQFQMGWALRTAKPALTHFMEDLKMKYLEKIKGFDLKKMSLVTIVAEGLKNEVEPHVKKVINLAVEMGAVASGKSAGEGGYIMSVVVAYIRDIALEFNVIADSIETTVPWDKIIEFDIKVRNTVITEALRMGVLKPVVMTRISQTYDSGCCYYINLALRVPMGADIIGIANKIKRITKDMCVEYGASISHHHGIGKQKRRWYENFISHPGANVLRAAKKQLDPNNIFASRNFLYDYTIKDEDNKNVEEEAPVEEKAKSKL